jgi:flagellar motility protein MotE (MotC chaperone)
MTVAIKTTIKSFLPYVGLLPAFYVVFAWGQFIEKADGRMFKDAQQKEEIISHATKGRDAYKNVHMELIEKDDRYAKQKELITIKDDIKETKEDIKVIRTDIKQLLKSYKD